MSSCFRFQGTEELATPFSFYTARSLEPTPHARFVFKYRPRGKHPSPYSLGTRKNNPYFTEFLRAQGIAPDDNMLDRAPENGMDQDQEVEDAEQEEQNRREILETQVGSYILRLRDIYITGSLISETNARIASKA